MMAQDAWKVLFPSEAKMVAGGFHAGVFAENHRAAGNSTYVQKDNTRTQQPIVTGAGVVGAKYRDGVMVIADTLASYGSLARYKDICRIHAVGEHTVVAAAGDVSDFQMIQRYLDEMDTFDLTYRDGGKMHPREVHQYLGRVMYNRRSKINPLWNELVVIGFRDGKSFLGSVDLHGTIFEENFIGNGMALHFALPLLRNNWRPDMSEEECRTLLEDCMKLMFLRHTTASPQVHLATVSAAGISISPAYEVPTRWDFEAFKRTPYNGLG